MRVGIFGGTFDPIHIGHLILAETCREACRLDKVLFVIAGEPPHKGKPRTSAKHRVEMVELAIAGHDAFEASEIELDRPGPHYSYETLERLAEERPGDELFFLIGADSLADLPGWRKPERICELASLVVVNRPGTPDEVLSSYVPPEGSKPFHHVTMPDVGVASRDIRRRVAEGHSARYLVPRPVEVYFQEHRIYDPEKDRGR